jgi:hypothetical protein
VGVLDQRAGGLLLVLGAIRYVPDVRHDEGTQRPDLVGALVLVAAVGALVLGLVQGSDWGWSSTGVLGAFGCSVLATAAFARRTVSHPSPVISPTLLAVPAFRWANLATLVFNCASGASLLGGILWLQLAWGFDALQTGLAIAVGPMVVPVAAVLAQRLFPAVRSGRMIAAGSLLYAAAAVWQGATLSTTPEYLTGFLPAWVLAGIGVGLAMPNLLAASTATLPPVQGSTGSGIVTMSRQVGLALGVSILVTIVDAEHLLTSFAHAWYAVALGMAAAALAALHLARVTTDDASPGARPVAGPVR